MVTFLNSEEVIAKTWEIVLFLTFRPESTHELIISLILGYLVVAIILAKAHSLGGNGSGSVLLGLFVVAFGGFGLIESAVFSELLLLPLMDKVFHPYAYYGSIIVSFFLLLVPFTRICFRSEYFSSVGAWVLALLVGGLVLFGLDYYFVEKDEKAPTVESVQKYTKDVKEKIQSEGERTLKKQKIEPKDPSPDPVAE